MHALHLAELIVDCPQRDATGRLIVESRKVQAASRRRIDAREGSEIFFECIGVEIGVDECEVMHVTLPVPCDERTHEMADCVQLGS